MPSKHEAERSHCGTAALQWPDTRQKGAADGPRPAAATVRLTIKIPCHHARADSPSRALQNGPEANRTGASLSPLREAMQSSAPSVQTNTLNFSGRR
ncbi:hypothetical protein J3F84DRAFT_382983 [Trichoderma pleuroticola]